ncbi:Schizosaccharomyces specific family with conserved tryptophan [Schizosaccharomyces osmophilus]|uniref:Schizosaccharomyces specific family with conserved tryptophan n=1 Tax=Schizosaccharomyces osmophilus TaxID=2545709 RepID=A0AAE9WD43_9SCHI|nr:Schizosaccharomyces specific family with conserved tryptophan [Schizosaccharomyces osmophilus]WBW73705.1 Schizosaccharomyces specific family with conserved tryptophan [Schizosaccharomyces osmophilus]
MSLKKWPWSEDFQKIPGLGNVLSDEQLTPNRKHISVTDRTTGDENSSKRFKTENPDSKEKLTENKPDDSKESKLMLNALLEQQKRLWDCFEEWRNQNSKGNDTAVNSNAINSFLGNTMTSMGGPSLTTKELSRFQLDLKNKEEDQPDSSLHNVPAKLAGSNAFQKNELYNQLKDNIHSLEQERLSLNEVSEGRIRKFQRELQSLRLEHQDVISEKENEETHLKELELTLAKKKRSAAILEKDKLSLVSQHEETCLHLRDICSLYLGDDIGTRLLLKLQNRLKRERLNLLKQNLKYNDHDSKIYMSYLKIKERLTNLNLTDKHASISTQSNDENSNENLLPAKLRPNEINLILYQLKTQGDSIGGKHQQINQLLDSADVMLDEITEKSSASAHKLSSICNSLVDHCHQLAKFGHERTENEERVANKNKILAEKNRRYYKLQNDVEESSLSPASSYSSGSDTPTSFRSTSKVEPYILRYLANVSSFRDDEKTWHIVESRYRKLTNRRIEPLDSRGPLSGLPASTVSCKESTPRYITLLYIHITIRETNKVIWISEVHCDGVVRGVGHHIKKGSAMQIAATQAAQCYQDMDEASIMSKGFNDSEVLKEIFLGRPGLSSVNNNSHNHGMKMNNVNVESRNHHFQRGTDSRRPYYKPSRSRTTPYL